MGERMGCISINKTVQNASFIRQFVALSGRYAEIIKSDRKRVWLLVAQPIVIALLVYFVVPTHGLFMSFGVTQLVMFAMVCSCIFMGLFNSIQEVCNERAIIKREYLVNLKLCAYVASKMAIQFIVATIQGITFVMVCHIAFGLESFLAIIAVAIMTIFATSSFGLLISSIVKSSVKAMLITPFILMIQLLFAGVLFLMEGIGRLISLTTISHWATRLLGIIARVNTMPDARILMGMGLDPMYNHNRANLLQSIGILLAIPVICGIASALVLRRLKNDTRAD